MFSIQALYKGNFEIIFYADNPYTNNEEDYLRLSVWSFRGKTKSTLNNYLRDMTTNYKTSFLLPHDYEIPTFNYPQYVLPPKPSNQSNWKLIDKNNSINNDKFDNEFSEENDKWYLFNNKNDLYLNYLVKNNGNIKRFKNNIWTLNTYNNDYAYFNTANIKSIYRWDSNGKPEKPTINKDAGEVIDWK